MTVEYGGFGTPKISGGARIWWICQILLSRKVSAVWHNVADRVVATAKATLGCSKPIISDGQNLLLNQILDALCCI